MKFIQKVCPTLDEGANLAQRKKTDLKENYHTLKIYVNPGPTGQKKKLFRVYFFIQVYSHLNIVLILKMGKFKPMIPHNLKY